MAPADFSKFAGILSAALSQHHLLGFEGWVGSAGFTRHKTLKVTSHSVFDSEKWLRGQEGHAGCYQPGVELLLNLL